MRKSTAKAGLDDFMLALGRATMTGDVVGVILRHSTGLLGASSAHLVVGNSARGRTWTFENDHIEMKPFDGTDAAALARAARSAADEARHHEFLVDGTLCHALVAERAPDKDEYLTFSVTRWGRRPFDERSRALFESIFRFVEVALQNMQLLAQLREKAIALEHLATHDPLTGLANRRRFQEEAERAINDGRAGAMLLVDLDRFKEVNDTLGHHIGDQMLVEVAYRLRAAVGERGLIARLGGDEFAVLLQPASSQDVQEQVRELHSRLSRPVDLGEVAIDVGASIGVSLPTPEVQSVGMLLRQADVAMYSAKSAKTDVELYDPDLDHYRPETLALVPRFRGAIENGELRVAFQPQFDTQNERVVGVEALARWSLPGFGPIPPSQFIPIAESTGLIRMLTSHVLAEAVEQCSQWQSLDDQVRVSVNIAPGVLLDAGFADRMSVLLDDTGLAPELLRLEVTETTVMADPERTASVLGDLSARGMTVAIDDFGTGHSSLSYLMSIPCHEIKIDRSFISALDRGDHRAVAVVAAIIGLGRDLDIDVVAEGVETAHAADQLRRLGCRVIQGFLYSRPVSAVELTRSLTGSVAPSSMVPVAARITEACAGIPEEVSGSGDADLVVPVALTRADSGLLLPSGAG